VVSPLVHGPARRFGMERVVLVALVVLTVGTVLRSLPAMAALWVGTLLIGSAIAIGNVLLPSLIKRDFPTHISIATGAYTAAMVGVAALASGLSVPLALGLAGGWRSSLGVWAALTAVGAMVWTLRMRSGAPVQVGPEPVVQPTASPAPSMWRSAVAWQVTLFVCWQSTTFYVLITWLPAIETSHGVSAVSAGWHLFLYQMMVIVSGLAVTAVMGRHNDQRLTGATATIPLAVAMLGLLLAPELVLVWVILAGLGSGSAFVLALSLIALRTRTPAETARLSGMAQSIGYLVGMIGPIAAGWISDSTGSWRLVIAAIMVLALTQTVVGFLAGRDRFTHLTLDEVGTSAR